MTRSWKNTSAVMKSPGIFCIPESGNAENGNYKIYLTRNRPNSARTFQASSGAAVASVRLQADQALWTDWTCTWVRCHGNRRASGKPGLSPAISYLDKSHATIVLNRHVSFTRICECYTFRVFSAKCAYRMFFPHKMAFSTAILILFVFLLPISFRFHYLDHLVANRMAPSVCLNPHGTRRSSWFQTIL